MLKFVAVAALLTTANAANLLGSNECTYGPSYWCDSFINAAKCSAMDHCTKVWKQQPVPNVADSVPCSFCKDIVMDLKSFLDSQATQSAITDYLDRACQFMPDDYSRTTCKQVAAHYQTELMNMIDGQLDPVMECSLLRLCGSKVSSTDLKQAAAITPLKATFARVSLSAVKTPVKAGDSPFCEACKTFIGQVKSEIDNKDNQDAIIKAMEAECSQIGGSFAAECTSLVDMFLPQMFSLLDQELNDQLCVMVRLCQNASITIDVKSLADRARSILIQKLRNAGRLNTHVAGVASRTSADLCTTCEEVLNTAKLFLGNNDTEAEIESVLENDICTQLGTFAPMCKEVVEQYMPQIWKQFMDDFDPKTLCTDLGLCNSTVTIDAPQLAMAKPTEVKPQASVQCVICEYVMTSLESMLSDNATEQEIERAVERVCDVLPSSISSECKSLVQQYGPQIIQLLVNDVPPSTVCEFLGLCSSVQKQAAVAKLGDQNCMMCTMALAYAKSMMTKNDTVAEVEKVLLDECSHMAGSLGAKCVSMVKQYTPAILKAVSDEISAKDVCTEIGLCKAAKKVDGLVHLYNRSNV